MYSKIFQSNKFIRLDWNYPKMISRSLNSIKEKTEEFKDIFYEINCKNKNLNLTKDFNSNARYFPQIIYSLEKNFQKLLSTNKEDFVQILSKLYEIRIDRLLEMKKEIKKTKSKIYVNEAIPLLMRNVDFDESKLLQIDDKKKIFSYASKVRLSLNDDHVSDCVFNNLDSNMTVEERLHKFARLLCYGNYYRDEILDELWNFCLKTLNLLLKTSNTSLETDRHFMKYMHLIKIITLFQKFDYTNSLNFKNDFHAFQETNRALYEIYRGKIDEKLLFNYVESLISLNMYVADAFTDLAKLVFVRIFYF